MSFLLVEKEKYSARVVLGTHDWRTSVSQLHENTTGVVLEQSFTDQKGFFGQVEGKYRPHKQFRDIVDEAKVKGVTLAAAEPQWTNEFRHLWFTISFSDSDAINGLSRACSAAQRSLIIDEGELDPLDANLKVVNHYAARTSNEVYYMSVNGPYKNLVMAQRVDAMAEYQLKRGIIRPVLALVVAVMHAPVADALKLSTSERVEQILEHPEGNKWVAPEGLRTVISTTFDQGKNKWVRKTFKDPRLKSTG